MQLKDYQRRVVSEVERYLSAVLHEANRAIESTPRSMRGEVCR